MAQGWTLKVAFLKQHSHSYSIPGAMPHLPSSSPKGCNCVTKNMVSTVSDTTFSTNKLYWVWEHGPVIPAPREAQEGGLQSKANLKQTARP
jgi:hypothetical protein